uniref:Uncharacterized protein n=1 Tax=Rhizophora mucronata TaxID=61149 RepID=A0A2P2P9G9_RHIMU
MGDDTTAYLPRCFFHKCWNHRTSNVSPQKLKSLFLVHV